MKTIVHGKVKARYSPDAAVLDRPLKFQRADLVGIPDDWTLVEVRDLKPFVTSGSRGWARFYSETGAPFLRITNLSRDSIYPDLEEIKFVRLPREASAEATRTQVREGDLLISITADIGVIGFVDSNVATPAYINQHIALIRFSKEVVSSRFVAYYLASEGARRLFVAVTDVGAKTGLNLTTIRKLQLALPALPEQRAVAEALSDVDESLRTLEALIAKKRAIKQGAMQQLLTGKTRLPGFSGEWKTSRIGDQLFYERPDQYIVRSAEYTERGDVAVLTANKSFILGYTDETFGVCRAIPAIVFDDFTTDCKFVTFPFKVKSSAIKLLRPRNHRVNLRYMFERMQLIRFPISDHKRHYIAEYRHIELSLPKYEEQESIVSVLSEMDAEIAALEARRDKTRAIKQGMMQQLLTGRIRLVKPRPAEVNA